MKTLRAKRRIRLIFALQAALSLSGCVAMLPDKFQVPRQNLERISQGPAKEFAPAELNAARITLDQAEAAARGLQVSQEALDLYYVADRKMAIAASVGRRRQAEARRPTRAPAQTASRASETLPPATTTRAVPAPARVPSAISTHWPDVSASLTSTDSGARDAALVVAIEDYAFLTDIPGAQQNGEDWFRYLTSVRKVPLARTRLLFNGEATDYAILANLKELSAQAEPGGKLWFVFIGHGAPSEKDRDGLLVAADAQQTVEGIEQRSVRQREVLGALGKRATPVVILDACYSGRSSDGSALVAGLQPTKVVSSPVPSDAIVISAAASNEYAGPLPGEPRPAFSYLALGALRGWGDEDQDGSVTASEVASYARGTLRVLLGASRSQSPQARGKPDAVLSHADEAGPDLGDLLLALRRRP